MTTVFAHQRRERVSQFQRCVRLRAGAAAAAATAGAIALGEVQA